MTALAGFVAVYLVPFLEYPANPPAVGNDATIGDRAGLYLVAVVGSVVLAAGAAVLASRLRARLSPHGSSRPPRRLLAGHPAEMAGDQPVTSCPESRVGDRA